MGERQQIGCSGLTRKPLKTQDEAAADSDRDGHPAATQNPSPLAPSALSVVRRF